MNEPSTLQVVLMGIVTVFVVLVCIIGIIKLLGFVMGKVTQRQELIAAGMAARAAVQPTQAAAQPAVGNKQQLVAAIAAAIAEEMGETVDHIRIHSIRRL